jgi:hypothetical protein
MLFVLMLLLGGLLEQNADSPLFPRPLKASGTRQLEVPSFGTYGNTQCDENLSMYDHLATGAYRHTEILRTSSSGNESTLYKLPEEFTNTTVFTGFSVSPQGNVVVLVELIEKSGHFITFDFDSDGKVSGHAELELPEHIFGDHISVFPNGTRLFVGHYRADAPPDLKGKRYVGLFQSSGKLIKRLEQLNDDVKEAQENHLPDGDTTIGRDGNVYLVTSDKVLAVSASGQIQKKIAFKKPDPDFSAVRVQYSDGWIVVSFAKARKPELVFEYLVVNASNGEPLGLYAPTEETGNGNVCFNRHDGFLFLKVKDNRLNLITAPLR